MTDEHPDGPLAGMRVVELGGIGPGPFAAMILADLGADVVRVDRLPIPPPLEHEVPELDTMRRSRRSLLLDLKSEAGVDALLRLSARADALIDPFRPGVTERLGIGPDDCRAGNPGLVYGRITGWGQDGPLAPTVGHDINYTALAGSLEAMGRRDAPPAPPLNLVGDFGGGGMLLVVGILAALRERERSGLGQVVDAAMVDGAALQSAIIFSMKAMGTWRPEREANLLDGGAHFYDTYETSDGRFVAVGAIEPRFYRELIERLELDPADWPQEDRDRWPELSRELAGVVRTRTLAEWCRVFDGSDACFTPVLSFDEAPSHPHLAARDTYVRAHGQLQPAPAPRFERTPGAIRRPPCLPGEHSREVLLDWGFAAAHVDALERTGATAAVSRRPPPGPASSEPRR